MKKYIVISLVLLGLFSCTKTIDFDDEGLANQLILTSIIHPDQGITANLTFSTSILSSPTLAGGELMADGTIEIYENGALIKEQYSPTGRFELTEIKPKAGAIYKVVGKSHDKQLEAETTIPGKVEVVSLDSMTFRDQYNTKKLIFKVKLKDQEGDDYYRITVNKESLILNLNTDGKGTRKYYKITTENSISSDNPVFKSLYNNFGGNELDMGPDNDYNIFPDDYFKGKEYSIQFQVNNYGYGNVYYVGGYGYVNSKTIYERHIVHIQHLSKDLFTYLKYLNLYDFYHDNPFAEPVPVYTNIKNGVGIFAGFNDEAKFTFEKIYIPFSMDTIKVEESSYGGY